jgi:hypothetical protein
LEQVNSWALISQQANNLSKQHYGVLIACIIDPISVALRHIINVVVAGESDCREEGQVVLESIYRSHVITLLVHVSRVYGINLPDRSIAAIINVLSELVLSSSKFLSQVSDR